MWTMLGAMPKEVGKANVVVDASVAITVVLSILPLLRDPVLRLLCYLGEFLSGRCCVRKFITVSVVFCIIPWVAPRVTSMNFEAMLIGIRNKGSIISIINCSIRE